MSFLGRLFPLVGFACGLSVIRHQSDGHNPLLLALALLLTGINAVAVLIP